MQNLNFYNEFKMPIIGFGTFQITGEECTKSVINAIETGYRLIDTAQGYGNEEFVGNAIKNCGTKREELFITTKVWFKNYKKEDCEKSLIESMKKLKVDYLDLVLLHWPFNDTYSAYRALEDFYKKGLIKSIGVSNYTPSQLVDLINYNEIKPMVNQVEINLLCQQKELREVMAKYNVASQAYSSLGQGKANYMFETPEIIEIAKKYNKTARQVALRYLIQLNIGVLPKTTSVDRMKENFNIFDFELTNDEMVILSKMDTDTNLIGRSDNYKIVESSINWG